MKAEERIELEALTEELLARNGVLEAMQSQVVRLLASLTDDPDASVRLTMADVRTNLHLGLEKANKTGDPSQQRIARRSLEHVNDVEARLLEMRRHEGGGGTQ